MSIGAIIAAALVSQAPAGHEHAHAHAPQLGRVDFPTTCAAPAQTAFERGLAWLHSFEYAEAEQAFAEAARVDPSCGMARWGVAMSQYHPLWAPPSPDELAKGRAALAEARRVGPRSPRETSYIAALEAFYADAPSASHRARVLAYTDAMARLHRTLPNDQEAAIFYALALIAAGMLDDDPAYAREHAAGAILNHVLAGAPDHPGVAHYLIHSFDYPALAHLAEAAARRYAAIAPASAHARHMPSHIFVRRGLWRETAESNVGAEAAARSYAAARRLPGSWDERLHALDYLMYARLQLGHDEAARKLLVELNTIRRVDPPNFKVAYAATAIPARYALERRRWDEAAALRLSPNAEGLVDWAKFPWARAHLHLARAVGSARSGRSDAARAEVERLRELEAATMVAPGEYDWRGQVAIQRRTAEAWLAFAEGRRTEALTSMHAAADLDDAAEKHPVTPGSILPAREQLGELLLEAGRPVEARAAFEAALRQAPNRRVALHGLARSRRSSAQ